MAEYIKDTDVYALFQPNGTAHLHVADIDVLPRLGDSVYYIHDNWCDAIEFNFFTSKDYDEVKDTLTELGKKQYDKKYANAIKQLEDHEQELEMLKGLLEDASDSKYVKSHYGQIKNRVEELPGRIEHYKREVENLELWLKTHGYIHFSGYSIDSVKLLDVEGQNLDKFKDC